MSLDTLPSLPSEVEEHHRSFQKLEANHCVDQMTQSKPRSCLHFVNYNFFELFPLCFFLFCFFFTQKHFWRQSLLVKIELWSTKLKTASMQLNVMLLSSLTQHEFNFSYFLKFWRRMECIDFYRIWIFFLSD